MHRLGQALTEQVVTGPADEQTGLPAVDCDKLATRFETPAIISVLEAGQGRLTAQTLTQAAGTLDRPGGQRDGRDAGAPDFQRLPGWVAASSTNLLRAYATPARPQP